MERGPGARDFFERLDRLAIAEAIRRAEEKGFGEIRVHVRHGRVGDARAEAERTFVRLGMAKTANRTGCLIFIVPEERAFAVVGDTAICERVGEAFWLEARDAAAALFVEERFTEGILAAVGRIGDALAKHFPKAAGQPDINELPDDVSES